MRYRFLLLLPLLLLLVFPFGSHAQELTSSQLNKLDPKLRSVLARDLPQLGIQRQAPPARPVPVKTGTAQKQAGPRTYSVFVKSTPGGRLSESLSAVNSSFRSVATARVTAAELAELARNSDVQYIAPSATGYPANDVAAGMMGVTLLRRGAINNTSYRGQGTLACIIDSGIDWSHGDFRGVADSTRSRILYVWDQTLQAQSGEQTPEDRGPGDFSGLSYGVEYSRSAIENEIDGSPAGMVRTSDVTGHGTHVAGTAAGNGGSLEPRQHIGMAPDAELIVVKSGDNAFAMTNVIDGMNYCGTIADRMDRPVVINMSLGSESGPRDGTSFVAQAVNSFLEDAGQSGGPGKVVVTSAGNSGDVPMHFEASLAAGDSADVSLEVPSYTPQSGSGNDEFVLDLWFDGDASARADVYAGDSLLFSQPAGGSNTKETTLGTIYIQNDVDPLNGDRTINVEVFDSTASDVPAAGDWTVRITNTSGSATSFHSWLYDYAIGQTDEAVAVSGGDASYTVTAPGTADRAITVGSYVHRWYWRTDDGGDRLYSNESNRSDGISSFSSLGPRRDGARAIDIAAPGQGMISSLSSDASVAGTLLMPGGRHWLSQGTSMAAPAVAGAAALLLQEDGSLTVSEIETAMRNTARTDSYTGSVPNDTWGYGKLDAFAALASIAETSAARELIKYDVWTTGGTPSETVTAGEKVALRFDPTVSGRVPGVLLHTYSTVSLEDSLQVDIWSNDGSNNPGSRIGSATAIAPDEIVPTSWNYLDLQYDGPVLTPGTSYHVVFTPTGPSDTLTVMAEWDGGNAARSSAFSGGSWNRLFTDLHIRPEIGPAATTDEVGTNTRSVTDLPEKFELLGNYPNPFNPTTAIPYTVATHGKVTLAIYNILGQKVRTLVDRPQAPGRYQVQFNGSELPSGVYFYRLEAGSTVRTRAMTLLK